MEYLIHLSNYRDREEMKQILKRLLNRNGNTEFEKMYYRRIFMQVRSGRNYELTLNDLGKLQLENTLKKINHPLIFFVKKTKGIYRSNKELSFEIEIQQNNIAQKFDVLRRIVSFAADYHQDSFIESELLPENEINPEAELGIKDEFEYEISPFLALEIAGRLSLPKVLSILFKAGFDGFTYYYDNNTNLHVILVYYLSDYRPDGFTAESGLARFVDKSLTLINSDESKRLFKSYQAGFRKIRLAQNGRGSFEESYEGFLQTLHLEEERFSNRK